MKEKRDPSSLRARAQCSAVTPTAGAGGKGERERETGRCASDANYSRTTLECITRSSINISNITRVL